MSDVNGFVVKSGKLEKYTGAGGNVVIPDGVTEIGDWAFVNRSNISEVTIPEGVTKIGANAFLDCRELNAIRIPDSAVIVGVKAFCGCKKMAALSISGNLKVIGMRAFEAPSLVSLELRNGAKIVKDMFGVRLPDGLQSIAADLAPAMDDTAFKQYVLTPEIWSRFDFDIRCGFLKKRAGKSLMSAYSKLILDTEVDKYGEYFVELISGEPDAAECASASAFLVEFVDQLSEDVASNLRKAIAAAGNGKKAAISAEQKLAKKKTEPKIDPSFSETARQLLLHHIDKKTSADTLISCWSKKLTECYSVTVKELPTIKYSNGNPVEPFVFARLLTENGDEIESDDKHKNGTPWYSSETHEIIQAFDSSSFQAALMAIADHYLGLVGNNKKMFLAFPICRFADEATMTELTRRAPQWSSYTSGNQAPPLMTFRRANKYNDSRTAMMFAEKYGDLFEYAQIRGLDEDTVRDKYLSDFGLDTDGCKKYDLGNVIVTARMMPDFSFVFELPGSKIAKSLPKKGADPGKYEAASNDFSEIKKNLKKTVKIRKDLLFDLFLNGRSKESSVWKASYTANPVLRKIAELVVWEQNGKTFTLSKTGPVDFSGAPFEISDDEGIRVAHPSEMDAGIVTAWQRYFISRGLKQPFEQVWEPVTELASVQPDRYKGCMIPYYRFLHREKHGITTYDNSYHNDITIMLEDCYADIERIEWERHSISPDHNFEIKSIHVNKPTRMVNHIITYLDKCTVYGRILKGDLSVADILPEFTPAQISDFIKYSAENSMSAVTALLLEYQNEHFADFDHTEEFTLD